MSSVQTTNLIKANKDFIVGYFQSKYKSNAWSFMNNKTDPLKRATHGAAHIKVTPKDAESKKLMEEGVKVDHYYYITSSIINWGNKGFRLSLRQDLIDCISVSEVPEENYHFLVLSGDLYADVTFKDLKSLRKAGEDVLSNQFKQTCLLYNLKNEMYHPKSLIAKPKYTNIKYDESNTSAYYEPSFRPECIGNVRYCKKCFKGLYCIDLYDEDKNLKKEEVIKGVSMRDLWNGLSELAGDTAELDCSSAVAFQNKFRKGRDVKLTNKDTKAVLYARIRELEKRVEVLEAEVKELKEFKEEATEEIKEIKEKVERFDNLDELVAKTTIKTFKKMLYDYCAAERNNLTYEKVREWGLVDAFLLALKSKAITKPVGGDYYFVHWDEIKNL